MSDSDRIGSRPWTDEEKKQLEKMFRAGQSVRTIAETLDRSPASVKRRIKELRENGAEQLSTGVFFIGLAALWLLQVPFWPGILFVFGATALSRVPAEGRTSGNVQGAIWMFGLGAVFLWGFSLPLLFLLIGLSSILGFVLRPTPKPAAEESEKRKNEELADYEKPKRDMGYTMRLGDDGELIEISEDESESRANRSDEARLG